MRRLVASFLEPRICTDTVMVVLTPVVADALALLRAGLVWSVTYDHGRLLGEVGLWDLFAGGHFDALRGWSAGSGRASEVVRRAIFGEPADAAALAAATHHDRALVLLADHAAGRPVDPAAVDALARAAVDDAELRTVAKLRQCLLAPAASYRLPLTDEPIVPVSAEAEPELYRVVATGDVAGCTRGLEAAIARANAIEATGTPYGGWPRIAAVCRLLTGDDHTAMAHLERARFADVRDDWVEVFGPLGLARVQREKDLVLAAIEQAFGGVPFPGPRHRSLYQAEAADNYAGCDQSRDHTGRWQDLPRQHVLDCQWALPHLGAESLPYYLPALMSFVVREHDQDRGQHGAGWIFDSVEYHLRLARDTASARAYAKDRHRLFTPAQFGAVARFAEYYRCAPEDLQHWRALAGGAAWPDPE